MPELVGVEPELVVRAFDHILQFLFLRVALLSFAIRSLSHLTVLGERRFRLYVGSMFAGVWKELIPG